MKSHPFIWFSLAFFLSVSTNASQLQQAWHYNAFFKENFSAQSSDVEGRLAAGGNIDIHHYSVGDKLDADDAGDVLVAGGHIRFPSGRAYFGHIRARGNIHEVGDPVRYGLHEGAQLEGFSQALDIDFDSEFATLKALSSRLAEQTANGRFDYKWGGLQLQGDCTSGVQIFNLNGTQVKNAHTFNVTCIPEHATVIFNISGKHTGLTNMSLASLSDRAEKVLFNFYEATSLTLKGIGVEGSILAPKATLHHPQGVVHGQVFAHACHGNIQFNHRPFKGRFPWHGDRDDDDDHDDDDDSDDGSDDNHDDGDQGQENRPPQCDAAVPSRTTLWPPNHKFSSVRIKNIIDPDNDDLAIEV